jgi:putative membrane protein
MNTIYHLIASVIAVFIGAYIVPGVSVTPVSACVLVVLLGVINMFFRPIIRLLTLPLNILTLGLFSLVVNAGIIMLLAKVIPDFHVATFWTAFFFALLVSLVTAFLGAFIKED